MNALEKRLAELQAQQKQSISKPNSTVPKPNNIVKTATTTRPVTTKPNIPVKPSIPTRPSPNKQTPQLTVKKSNKRLSVWDELLKQPRFMQAFDAYNKSAGNAFTRLKKQKHDIKGREIEEEILTNVMERPDTPVAALLAKPGVGKSALVEDFIKRIDNHQLNTVEGRRYFVVSLRVGYLKALGNDKLQSVLTGMLDELHKLELIAQDVLNDPKVKIILFIDEMHMLVTIFGPGTKIGGDLMKDVLARCPIRVITATTRREFDSTIAVDEAFKERFKEIELNELPKSILLEIMENWWHSKNLGLPLPSRKIFEKILDANALYRASSAEPRKSLDTLEDLIALQLRYPKIPITESSVNKIFKDRFNIELDFKFDADDVFNNVKSRIKGQALALFELKRAFRSVSFRSKRKINRPIMTLLFCGSPGVGKALPEDDYTLTLSGFKKNKDIQVGDMLFDRLGNPTPVLGVYPQGKRSVYRLTLEDGRTISCDKDHLFSFYINDKTEFNTQSITWLKNNFKTANYYLPMNKAVRFDESGLSIDNKWKIVLDLFKEKNNQLIYKPYNPENLDALLSMIYSLGISPKLENGFIKLNGLTKDQILNATPEKVKIVDITNLNKKTNTVCFLVGNDEHLFQTTKQYIVTHNTETTKAIADSLYPGENVLVTINCPDFKTASHEPLLRKLIGETARHQPKSVFLFDEYEKMHPAILDSMLSILDEGIVNFEIINREGQMEMHSQSLRNTIIIATSNAGHEIFHNHAQFAQNLNGEKLDNVAKAEYESLTRSLNGFLIDSGFRPEMLNRFNRIIPYKSLSKDVIVTIAENSIQNLIKELEEDKNISIILPVYDNWKVDNDTIYSSDVAAFIGKVRVKADDPSISGARAIRTEVEKSLADELIEYICDHPTSTKFKVYVHKESKLYVSGASPSEGGIIVEALN